MAHHPVSWFQITGPNGKALAKFYERVFSWDMKEGPGGDDQLMVDAEKGGIPGSVGRAMDGKGGVAVYISVGDLDQYIAKVHDAGGKLAMPPMQLPGDMGAICGVTDPAGNWIGLWAADHSPKKAAKAKKKSAEKAAKSDAKAAKKNASPKKADKAKKSRR